MEFRILGPIEARKDGLAVSPGGPKLRALLALLLVNANELVSHARLIDGLWGESPPESAAKALQVYVSQLRRELGRERIRTRPGGYELVVDPDALDLLRFERLVAEARVSEPAAASQKLGEALALWRGAALADVAEAAFAAVEIGRLEELRLTATEELVDAELALGHDAELVSELERLVAQNPVRERLRGQLMLALYRSGRQADSLQCYQDARSTLVDELGIEPGNRLRELHQAILRQDSELDAQLAESEPDPPPPDTTESLPLPNRAVREARKTITAVCVALSTSSGAGDSLDPETLRHVMNRAVREIATTVEHHGGTVETVTGDAVFTVFGLPLLHEDDAVRAVRSAVEFRDRFASLAAEIATERDVELGFGVGIGTGEVVTGGDAAVELRATGIPLAVSSRLAQRADPGAILVDEATLRLVRAAALVEPVAVGSTPAFSVLGLEEGTTGHTSRFVSPMVGRERERRRLQDAFEQAAGDRSCQLFTVLGPAGVGKSRLVREFLSGLRVETLVARGRCLPYGEGITFWPLLEAIKEAVGLDDADSPQGAREKLVAALAEEADAELVAERVAEMIGLADVRGAAEDGNASVLALVEALARVRPLVLVFDDIHWGEPTFLDLVEQIADRVRDAPILLLCLARPDLLDARPTWGGGKLNATSALLEPLSVRECGLLIANLVGRAELPEDVGTRIAEAAEGNPLFVEEMLSMLIDDGVLMQRNGGWMATGDLPALRVPPTIQALLAARLDRLEPDDRAVLELGAIQGKQFYEGALAELLSGEPAGNVAGSLASLVRKELIRPDRSSLGGRTHRFRHLLIRDAAYDSIPKEARAAAHERFAHWLERTSGDRATEYEEIVGYHLEQSYRYRDELGPIDDAARALARAGAERLGAAGRRAFSRSDAPAALNLMSRAVSLLPPQDPLRVDLIPSVRHVQGMGDLTWADEVLTDAVEAAKESGDTSLAAHALVQRGLLRLFSAANPVPLEFMDIADQAIPVFEKRGDDVGLSRAWRLVGQAHYLDRRGASCAEATERALRHAQRADDRFEEGEAVEWLGIALVLGSTPASDAEQKCRELLRAVTGHPAAEVNLLGSLAYAVAIQGRNDEFKELMARAEQTAAQLDAWTPLVPGHFAWATLSRNEPHMAEQALLPDYERLKRIGEKSHFSSITSILAQALYAQGRYDEAAQLAEETAGALRPNDVHSQIVWKGTSAKLLARRGELVGAERLAREAVAFAETSDFLTSHAGALMDLAEVLELVGRRDEAAEHVRAAVRLYEQKGSALGAEHALARLDALVV